MLKDRRKLAHVHPVTEQKEGGTTGHTHRERGDRGDKRKEQ